MESSERSWRIGVSLVGKGLKGAEMLQYLYSTYSMGLHIMYTVGTVRRS